ncbi:MAG: beta-N-acetylhexosaminidase, partial [Proteobacteria bacterium]|nr:beta-N-acetylhexosaminidase [Pseudomonadota bacterium]
MLIIGIEGRQLRSIERDWICAPQVSGVILFKRNFESREQVAQLIAD